MDCPLTITVGWLPAGPPDADAPWLGATVMTCVPELRDGTRHYAVSHDWGAAPDEPATVTNPPDADEPITVTNPNPEVA